MPLLLALCGDKHNLSVKEVVLSQATQRDVTSVFLEQEKEFRDGDELEFDSNWINEGKEIAVTAIPEGLSVFDEILTRKSDTSFETFDPSDLSDLRGLAIRTNAVDPNSVLVQAFSPSLSLNRSSWVSLVYEKGTFNRLETSGFRLNDKLALIVEDGKIKFRSLYDLRKVIDTSGIFKAATDLEVTGFVDSNASIFHIEDLDEFVGATSQASRKYIASIQRSQALESHDARSLQREAKATKLELEVHEGKIVMPTRSGAITELLRFLNDGRYVGPVSKETFITNSRRPTS